MKKYRLNYIYILLQFTAYALFCAAGYYAVCSLRRFPLDAYEAYQRRRILTGLIIVAVCPLVQILPERLNKNVVIAEEFMECNNFQLRKMGKIRNMSFRLYYKSISRLHHKKVLGIFDVYEVYEQSLGKPLKITFQIWGHKKMFREFCSRLNQVNPSAVID